jgi:hypothetical protein
MLKILFKIIKLQETEARVIELSEEDYIVQAVEINSRMACVVCRRNTMNILKKKNEKVR